LRFGTTNPQRTFSQTSQELLLLKLGKENEFTNDMDASTSEIEREAVADLKHASRSFQRNA